MVGSGDDEAAPPDGSGLAPPDGPTLKRRRKSPRLAAARPEEPGDEVDSAAQHSALRGERRGRAQRPPVDPVVEIAVGRGEVWRAGGRRAVPSGRVGTGPRARGERGAPGRLSGLGPLGLS